MKQKGLRAQTNVSFFSYFKNAKLTKRQNKTNLLILLCVLRIIDRMKISPYTVPMLAIQLRVENKVSSKDQIMTCSKLEATEIFRKYKNFSHIAQWFSSMKHKTNEELQINT